MLCWVHHTSSASPPHDDRRALVHFCKAEVRGLMRWVQQVGLVGQWLVVALLLVCYRGRAKLTATENFFTSCQQVQGRGMLYWVCVLRLLH